jgi:hypothetical protein
MTMTIRKARPRPLELTFLRPLRRLAWAAAALPLLGGGCSSSSPSETAAEVAEVAEVAGGECQQVDEKTVRVASDLPGIAAWTLRTDAELGLFTFDTLLTLTGEDAAGAARITGKFHLHFTVAELIDPNSLFVRAGDGDPSNDPTPDELIAFYRAHLYEDRLLEDGAPIPPERYLQTFASLQSAFAGCAAASAGAATLTADGGDNNGGLRLGRERMVGLWLSGGGFLGAIGGAAWASGACASILAGCAATGVTGIGLALCVGAVPACGTAGAAIAVALGTAATAVANGACDVGLPVPFLEPVRGCTCEREQGVGALMYGNLNRRVCYSCPSGTGFEVAHEGLPDRCICGSIGGQAFLPQHVVDDPATGQRRAICDGRVCVNTYTFSAGFNGLTYGTWEHDTSLPLGSKWGELPINSKLTEQTACGSDIFSSYRALGSTCEPDDTSSMIEGVYVGQDILNTPLTLAYTSVWLPGKFDDYSYSPGSAWGKRDARGTTVECGGGPYWCDDGEVHACTPAQREAAKKSTNERNPPTGP